jgi:hypothetical protein
LAVLPLMVELVMIVESVLDVVSEVLLVKPPPNSLAVLPVMVERSTVSAPSKLLKPPPKRAELLLTVESCTVSLLAWTKMPPPIVDGGATPSAIRLGAFFKPPAELWMNLQMTYDLRNAEKTLRKSIENNRKVLA